MSEQSRAPGWYQDPFGTRPDDRRYWDGETWLAVQQTQPAQFDAPGAPQQPQPIQQPETHHGPSYGGSSEPADGWGEQRGAGWGGPASPEDRERTPDGVELATWGRRFAAYLIDVVVLGVVTLILGAVLGVWPALTELVESIDPESTDLTPQFQAFVAEHSGTMLLFTMLQLVASGLYHVVLVATRGRTIGKRMVGIRVRLREREGLPIWRAALSRWLLHFAAPNLLSGVPGLGFVAVMFPLVDGLWPLWDARRQAIHDKVAKTAVVRG